MLCRGRGMIGRGGAAEALGIDSVSLMDVRQLLIDYGPAVIFIWTFFEGETVLLAAGFLAQQGYMSLDLSILAAFLGSMAGDQLYFQIGRKYGRAILDWRPRWRDVAERALRLLVRYQNLFILSFRFIYMVRNVASFAIGMAGVSFKRFTILNAVAAAIWALSFGFGGYVCGKTLDAFVGKLHEVELVALGLVVLAAFATWRRRRARRRQAPQQASGVLSEASGGE